MRNAFALAAALSAGLGSPAARARDAAAPPPLAHKIAVDARGPLALVEVTRELDGVRGPGGGVEALLDLALPDRGVLVSIEVRDGERWREVDQAQGARATAAAAGAADVYQSECAARGATPASEPYDDSAVVRVRVARGGRGGRGPLGVRYRFAAPPSFVGGRYRLRFPAATESVPPPAEVTVTTRDAGDLEIAGARAAAAGGGGRATGRASTRAGWEISWTPRDPAPAGDAPALEARLAVAPASATETAVGYALRSRAARPAGPPSSVLLLVDRSRSVGLPGLSAERDLGRRLLESLPPSLRFDALFFDRGQKRLFPMSRPATREAIETFEAEMVPSRLENGTDLPAVLREAGGLLRREASAFGPRALLVVITDGAIPDQQDGGALDRALGKVPGLELAVAAFAVRPADDDPMSSAARQALRAFAGARGGIAREVVTGELDEAVREALVALDRGGDLTAVRLGGPGHARTLADALAPGAAAAGVVMLTGGPPDKLEIEATAHGRRIATAPQRIAIPRPWLRALGAPSPSASSAGTARVLIASSLVALVEPVPHPAAATEPPVRGSMDRLVMRNVLSLAYMPRARACYLDRTGATPAERDLAGRVRLAIDVARGEVERANIQSSTLNHADIERCLREGAFAIEVPRAVRSDAPVTAILNLVFRPRTTEKRPGGEPGGLADQIDLLVEEAQREAEGPTSATIAPTPEKPSFPTR
jgi:hypothetical protein